MNVNSYSVGRSGSQGNRQCLTP